MNTYILEGQTPVPCEDVLEWGKWFETANRKVARDKIGESEISTVFLGLDHGDDGKVLLFETMIFGGRFDGTMARSCTWGEAEAQHRMVCDIVKAVLESDK